MIDLYTWGTPNGRKVSILLEELGLAYRVHTVDITKDEQFAPDFLALNPNNKIPVIVDSDGPDGQPVTVFESGAILIYLAEKAKSPLYPRMHGEYRARLDVLQWLMFQMGSVGPMFGQTNHFMKWAKEEVPYAKKRYRDEALRLYGVMDKRLGAVSHLAGDFYSIADIATYPWVCRHDWHQVDLNDFPNLKRWYDELSARPAVQKGMEVPS